MPGTRPLHRLRLLLLLPVLALSALGAAPCPEGGKALPAAPADGSCREELLEAAGGADRVLLREGGPRGHGPAGGAVLLDSRDPEEVRYVLDAIDIREPVGRSRCLCGGEYAIEFRRGDDILVELGVALGERLKWPGRWPGDAFLTDRSRGLLTAWMAGNGAPEPRNRWRREQAARARRVLLSSRMPPAVHDLLLRGECGGSLAERIRSDQPDPRSRALLCLRLYGVLEGSWNAPRNPDPLLERALLPEFAAPLILEVIGSAREEAEVLDGAARWLFAGERWRDIEEGTAAGLLSVLGPRALAHPRAWNRRRVLEVLGGMPSKEATALLRRCLDPGIPPRPPVVDLPEDPPEGTPRPGEGPARAPCSDRAYAAVLLARRGDRESLPVIRAMRTEAPEADRAILDEAIDLLAR